MIKNDDDIRLVSFASRTIVTDRGSEVTVGHACDEDSGIVLRFKNNQGTETIFSLSGVAFDALRALVVIPREYFITAPVILVRYVVDGSGADDPTP